MADWQDTFELGKEAWTADIRLTAQQMSSKMQRLCTRMSMEGERKFTEWLGKVKMNEGYRKSSPIEPTSPDFWRRWIHQRFFDLAFDFDKVEELQILKNPTNKYIVATRAAANRAVDEVILDAVAGTAWSGKHGTDKVELPASQIIPHGDTGFTLAKLKQAVSLFKKVDADDDDSGMGLDLSVVWTPDDEELFLDEAEVKSHDFNTQRLLMKGRFDNRDVFYGCNYTRTNLLPEAGGVHTAWVWRKDAIEYAFGHELSPRVSIRTDLQAHPTEVYSSMEVGATRVQEALVVGIECKY